MGHTDSSTKIKKTIYIMKIVPATVIIFE